MPAVWHVTSVDWFVRLVRGEINPARLGLGVVALVGAACGVVETPSARFGADQVWYQGAPYGDFLTLADEVRRCMESDDHSLPRIVLLDGTFDCYTRWGWREVYGCSGGGVVYIDARHLLETHGAVWSHELTHYFGATAEDNPCGTIALDGFAITPVDASSGTQPELDFPSGAQLVGQP